MKCPGLHCDGCGGGDGNLFEVLVLFAVPAAVATVVLAYIEEILIAAGVIVGSVLAVTGFFVWRNWRKGWRPSLNPVVYWNPHAAVRAPAAPALTAEQLAGLAQLGQAIHDVRADGAMARQHAITNRRTP